MRNALPDLLEYIEKLEAVEGERLAALERFLAIAQDELYHVDTILREALGVTNPQDTATQIALQATRRIQGLHLELHEVDQILGKALGYPPNPDGAEGVCTADNSPASLALEAADKLQRGSHGHTL